LEEAVDETAERKTSGVIKKQTFALEKVEMRHSQTAKKDDPRGFRDGSLLEWTGLQNRWRQKWLQNYDAEDPW